MPSDKTTRPTSDEIETAFAAGACAAYDDLGITEPQWHLGLTHPDEVAAWKRGLEQGYADCAALTGKSSR